MEEQKTESILTGELNVRLFERADDHNKQFIRASNEAAVKEATFVVRTLVLINGGAAISILTFAGNLASKSQQASTQIVGIANGLNWLTFGVITATVSAGLSYLTNYCYAGTASSFKTSLNHPYLFDTTKSKMWRRFGFVFHVSAIVLVIASLIAFAAGVIAVGDAVKHFAP
jgi:hypothetical protein